MYSLITIIAATSLLAVASGSPLLGRSNVCGNVPSAGSTSNQPISQLSGIQTALSCQSQCDANSSCLSFCFGLVDNVIQCELFAVAASQIPTQSSANLVAYDKACSGIPSVTPTSSNPTGKAQDSNQQAPSTGNQQTPSTSNQENPSTGNQDPGQ